jgi:uridine kinase
LTLDADVCLSRRLVRDINERGRHLEGILKQYFSFVKPSNENYIHKQAQIADIVIPHGPSNVKAIGKDLLHDVIHIRRRFKTHFIESRRKICPAYARFESFGRGL